MTESLLHIAEHKPNYAITGNIDHQRARIKSPNKSKVTSELTRVLRNFYNPRFFTL